MYQQLIFWAVAGKSLSHRKAIQHRRSIEILRERAWVARLNVRSRMRKRESTIIKRFLIEADKVGRLRMSAGHSDTRFCAFSDVYARSSWCTRFASNT